MKKNTFKKLTLITLIAAVTITSVKGYNTNTEYLGKAQLKAVNNFSQLKVGSNIKPYAVTYTWEFEAVTAAGGGALAVALIAAAYGYSVYKAVQDQYAVQAIFDKWKQAEGGIITSFNKSVNESLQMEKLN